MSLVSLPFPIRHSFWFCVLSTDQTHFTSAVFPTLLNCNASFPLVEVYETCFLRTASASGHYFFKPNVARNCCVFYIVVFWTSHMHVLNIFLSLRIVRAGFLEIILVPSTFMKVAKRGRTHNQQTKHDEHFNYESLESRERRRINVTVKNKISINYA